MTTKKTNVEKVEKKEKVEKEEKVVEEVKTKPSIGKYFFKMFLIFMLIELGLLLLTGGLSEISLYTKYSESIINEVFFGILALIVMLLFKNSYVFTNKQEKFYKSLLFGIPMLVVTLVYLVQSITSLTGFNMTNFIAVLILTALIGITEEFLFRGWIQNEFIERFGDSRKNIILSIGLSALIFGLTHLTNVIGTGQTLFETLLQVFNATALGFFLGTIYYKTKNIWSVIFLHGMYDFAIMLGEINQIKDCTYGVANNQIVFFSSVTIVVLAIYWILSAVLVIKKTNYPDKKATRSKDHYLIIVPFLAFTLVLALLPYEKLIDDYDNYYICYEYKNIEINKDYVTHYPHHSEYNINYVRDGVSYVQQDDKLKSIIEVEDFTFKIYETKDGYLNIRNENTGFNKVLLEDLIISSFVLIENEDNYTLIVDGLDKNFTQNIYYTEYLSKETLSNSNEYLENITGTFTKLDLPDITDIGYITIEGSKKLLPLFYSNAYDKFIIDEGELFLVK